MSHWFIYVLLQSSLLLNSLGSLLTVVFLDWMGTNHLSWLLWISIPDLNVLWYPRPVVPSFNSSYLLTVRVKGTRTDAVLILEIKFSATKQIRVFSRCLVVHRKFSLSWNGNKTDKVRFRAEVGAPGTSAEKGSPSIKSWVLKELRLTWALLFFPWYLKHVSWFECHEYWICMASFSPWKS